MTPIDIDDAFRIIDEALPDHSLSNVQEAILRHSWQGKTYQQIADLVGYDPAYIRDVGYKLWRHLGRAFGEKVTKGNLQSVIRRYTSRTGSAQGVSLTIAPESPGSELSGASKILGQLSRLLNEPNSEHRTSQTIAEFNSDNVLQLTITVRVDLAAS
ncbi:MAG: hypothetical protein HC919_08725 [Oscillatoriales cyanobacterium SM2_2_1]|nr:hypothetical protein [Oscillatoriales cyanobacterium SM2_2_1]